MIQRMSDSNKISFLDLKKENVPVVSKSKEDVREISDQKARKLSNQDDGMKTDKHICSARTGSILDVGGPTKYTKSETSNTVWDSEKISRSSDEIKSSARNREDTEIKEKETIEENKMVESKKAKEEASPSFSRLSDLSGSTYRSPNSGMSIFDSEDFQRLADKTQGESLSEEVKKKMSMKDDSWKGNGKMLSSKDFTHDLMSRLFK